MDYLVLINRASAPVEHGEGERERLLPVGGTDVFLERQAACALERLMERIDGWRAIVPVSGWRSGKEQKQIWEESLRENGMEDKAEEMEKRITEPMWRFRATASMRAGLPLTWD